MVTLTPISHFASLCVSPQRQALLALPRTAIKETDMRRISAAWLLAVTLHDGWCRIRGGWRSLFRAVIRPIQPGPPGLLGGQPPWATPDRPLSLPIRAAVLTALRVQQPAQLSALRLFLILIRSPLRVQPLLSLLRRPRLSSRPQLRATLGSRRQHN